MIKTICDSVNHTRFPKEDHLPDWARRDNKVTKGDRVEVDNAPGYPAHVHDFHSNVKVVFVPPNTTLCHPPVDWGIIATSKSCYLRRIFVNLMFVWLCIIDTVI